MRVPLHLSHRHPPTVFGRRASRFYDLVAGTVLRRLYRRLAQDIADAAPEGAAVLDIGTGPGVLLVELARLRPDLRLTGLDLSPDMVAAATRRLAPYGARATAQVGDVIALPFAGQSFDLIVSSLSLHHWDDPEAAVPQLARVLRPGGSVRIYDFRFAPYDRVTAAAGARSVLIRQPPQRTTIRTGIPLFPHCDRFVMSS